MTDVVCSDVLIVTGTRPEIIKMAPVYFSLKAQGSLVVWCHTGQHDSLAEQTFDVFSIRPDFILQRPKGDGVSGLVSGLIDSISELLLQHPFKAVLVHGDTATTFTGALAAFYQRVPIIAHVEAGLRSGNMQHPFPEESNRQMVARIANLHFAPTAGAHQALVQEGISSQHIHLTGNTAIDAQVHLLTQGKVETKRSNKVLVTAHRRENWANIATICQAVKQLSVLRTDLEFVFAVHPNPQVKQQVLQALEGIERVTVSEPLDYLELQQCLAEACLVLTDSGGIQEEAPTFGTRVVVLRETTERPEAVAKGYSVLSGADKVDRIVTSALEMLSLGSFSQQDNPFGDGKASEQIARVISEACCELS
ncbi:non-hydrolyzing UDP-N-acetylglucosamine 2-epimerase [Vibrio coralliilyticus]|uniref:non-hydrolyzing UDP-N-acetylglucosamine 2-epimerase n=1 Tax=Vibrio coralliilyticus TaxID=190893 RepID=UPI000BAAE76C|nr:UDP-N-acetylglucosamine 2-epimerase (non-hydrolyzing) [Vibrio coralliilyticus]NOI57531.1 UDP-N-acetylglucosamine 2-epimerase (non-hydrolyzing) [Vibrio coralliilyticus]PAT67801.1 UDP-N-acetylglucosamine 2-epimerase (non-hydrolyzing) [Vibrio coralliilyticus]